MQFVALCLKRGGAGEGEGVNLGHKLLPGLVNKQAGFAPNDLWLLKTGETETALFEWSATPTSGTRPGPRYQHSAVAGQTAADGEVMIVFGGNDDMLALTNELHILSLGSKTWTLRSPTNPPMPRGGHSAVWAAELAKMLVASSG